ncbi:MAG: hypothetical protein IJ217_00015 [Clostridia bacterium]|nr:hypothetical protein [Clostridia bacterium]
MENLETFEINTEDLLTETADYDLIEINDTTATNDLAADIDIDVDTMGKRVATPANGYTEIGNYSDIPDSVTNGNSSSVLPLCITVILCLAAGIALGIWRAKKAANK